MLGLLGLSISAARAEPPFRELQIAGVADLGKQLGLPLNSAQKNPKSRVLIAEFGCPEGRDDCDNVGRQCWAVEGKRAWTLPSCPATNAWSPDGKWLVLSGRAFQGLLIVGLDTLRSNPKDLWSEASGATELRAPMMTGGSSDFTSFWGWASPKRLRLGGGCCGTTTFVTCDLDGSHPVFGCTVAAPDATRFNVCPK